MVNVKNNDNRTLWFLCPGNDGHAFRDGKAMCGKKVSQPGVEKMVCLDSSPRSGLIRTVGQGGRSLFSVTGKHWGKIVCRACRDAVVDFWARKGEAATAANANG